MNIENDLGVTFKWSLENLRNYIVAFILLFAILMIVYSNSFECSWHFDDFVNITENKSIQIKDFSWQEIKKSFSPVSEINRSLNVKEKTWTLSSRPISYFSFAVNYYFGDKSVFGFHVVNFFIHYLSAVSLFLLIYNLLNLPLLAEKYKSYSYSVAFLTALLWSIHPIQVTAVTYIVQRMASMMALFYIVAMYLYLKGRTSPTRLKAAIFYFFSMISFVLALGSKQNAVMLPVVIVLFDFYFIQGVKKSTFKRTVRLLFVMLCCALVFLFIYVRLNPSVLDYSCRSFDMMERLLTQPRIFFYYISLLLYPINSRLMINHDILVSTSIFFPWTTSVAIIALVLLLGVALWNMKRYQLISFSILFFFINHLIEGSFFSLELVFEHRNYLPSMFIFLPISIGLLHSIDYFAERKTMLYIIIFFVTSIVIILGVATYMYNDIFKNELTLWSDNARKAPALRNPHHNLALAYLDEGMLKEGYDECIIAMKSYNVANTTNIQRIYVILVKYYIAVNDRDKVMIYNNKALEFFPDVADLHNIKGLILLEKNELSDSEKEIRQAISLQPDNALFRVHLGLVFLKRNQFNKAIKEAQKALQLNTDSWQAYLLLSNIFKEMGAQRMSKHFFQVNRRLQLEKSQAAAIDRR